MKRFLALWLASGLAIGCATTTPYVGYGPHPQLTRGAAVPPIDVLGNVLSLPGKLILWDWDFNRHAISEATETTLITYLEAKRLPAFEDTIYRLNQYAPFEDLRALVKNRHVAWPYRVLIGLPVTLLSDVLLPGRVFPWGDYYNPYTNTVHLYSDNPTIALHEAGHAYDFANFPYKGTYALLRLVPLMDLYQEKVATEHAINHLIVLEDRETEFRAYRTLWPAYGTYVGSYVPMPLGSIAGAAVGHIAGRVKAKTRQQFYQRMDAALQAPERYFEETTTPSRGLD